MERGYPPRIDASPETIANVVLNAKRPARFGSAPKRIEYRCAECDRPVLASNYSTNSKSPRVGYVRRFVDWIDDAYSPADYPGDR